MNFSTLLFPLIIVLLAIPLFMGTRKQKRVVAAQQELQNSLSYGDRVMTTSGLYGTVVSTSDNSVDLEIAPGLVTSWLRAAVREKVADSIVDGLSADDADDVYADDDADHVETTDAAAADVKVEDTVNGVNGSAPASDDDEPSLEKSSKKAN